MVFYFSSTSSLIHLDSNSRETDTSIHTVLSSGLHPPGNTCGVARNTQHPNRYSIHHCPYGLIHFAVSRTEHFAVKEGLTGVLGHTLRHRLVSLGY